MHYRVEEEMLTILSDLRANHGVVGLKVDFEAEGTRMEEAVRVMHMARTAGISLTVKIGGCAAMRDIFDAKLLGAKRVVATMVESPFALSKFMDCIEKAFSPQERESVEACANIESITGTNNFDGMMDDLKKGRPLEGIVVGRVDLTSSMGLGRGQADSDDILGICYKVLKRAKHQGLKTAVGGAVTADSLRFLGALAEHLDHFETRKVIFDCKAALAGSAADGLRKAAELELLWLKGKQAFYAAIADEDADRLGMMASRLRGM